MSLVCIKARALTLLYLADQWGGDAGPNLPAGLQSPDHLGLPRSSLSSILDQMMGLNGRNVALLSTMDSYKKLLALSHASLILETGPLGV